jgi:hypothetical protein
MVSELSVVLLSPFRQMPVYCRCLAPIVFLYIPYNLLLAENFDIRHDVA